MKAAGILLPIFSLPGPGGIGSFGKEAYRFADRLADCGQSFWQILPLGITGYGDSPYQSFSSFAGNPYFISLELLVREGLLREEDIPEAGPEEERIDYGALYQTRYPVLRKAFSRFRSRNNPSFEAYCREESDWLDDYSLFMALKKHFGGSSWLYWPEEIRRREPGALKSLEERVGEDILFYKFLQYQFHRHWSSLKSYVNSRGIRIIGDIPIYTALDSCEVWSDPGLFQLDENLSPTAVAGCPPDGFSDTGQLWGNPLYRWEAHKEENFAWWKKRVRRTRRNYDVIRIDHFRGFDSYYSIPAGDENAIRGHWETGPGYDLFAALKKDGLHDSVIAEDLGYVTESVRALVDRCGFPGMKVFQFGFDSRDQAGAALYRPEVYPENSVAYTGTHDNETMKGWFHSILPEEKKALLDCLGLTDPSENELLNACLECLMATRSRLVIIPMQDYLGLGNRARLNRPSTIGENWSWRMKAHAFDEETAGRIRDLTSRHGRLKH